MSIRPATPDDAARIAAIYAPYVTNSVATFEEVPPGADEIARRMTAYGDTFPWLVRERGGTIIGYAYARPYHDRPAYRWTCETTIYLAEDERRRGQGRALYEALLDELTDRNFVAAIASITVPNPQSVRFHERLDFTYVGTMEGIGFKAGAWRDVGYWQIPLGPRTVPPPGLAL